MLSVAKLTFTLVKSLLELIKIIKPKPKERRPGDSLWD